MTQKVVKKKQRMKGKGQVRTIQKTIKEDSFFNFFSPPLMPEDEESVDEELEALLTTDFEVCLTALLLCLTLTLCYTLAGSNNRGSAHHRL